MKRAHFFMACLLLLAGNALAQLQLPAPSPKAQVMQTVGLTEITIDYSCPGVKGRTVWGDLVPYDKLWRAGANAATKITFSKDVVIEGVNVAKGSYSIFMIPANNAAWTIILNKDASASTDSYKQESDVVRIKSFPGNVSKRERLSYAFSNFSDDQVSVDMEWDNVRVSFSVKTDTEKQAQENIKGLAGSTWRNYANAARFQMEKKNLDEALKLVNTSLSVADEWYNNWIKAQIMAEMKDHKNAYALAQKAKELGDKNPAGFFYKEQVEKALADWKPLAEAGGKKKK